MFVAMNRFKVAAGHEDDFVEVWASRETFLDSVPGFKEFHLLRGPGIDGGTLFASHSIWESREAFEEWTRSEAFRKAHSQAGARRDIYLGPPNFEGFESVL